MADNYLQEHEKGAWVIQIYNPAENPIGPFLGTLKISKDFHTVVNDDGVTLVSVPSQNVSYCLNTIEE